MLLNLQETADLVTFTEEIPNGKLHFLCSDYKVFFCKQIRKTTTFKSQQTKKICKIFHAILSIQLFYIRPQLPVDIIRGFS